MNYNNNVDDHIKSFLYIILKQKGMNCNDNMNNKTILRFKYSFCAFLENILMHDKFKSLRSFVLFAKKYVCGVTICNIRHLFCF